MGRFRNSGDDNETESIDISPLIDCVFILLIFFIVTTTFVDETGVTVDKPQAASSVQLEKTSLLIAITAEGQIMASETEIGIGGVGPLVRRQMEAEVVPVIIQADTQADAGLLVRVIDEAKLAGADKISIASLRAAG
jgi:biopolymer transport protein ExbD